MKNLNSNGSMLLDPLCTALEFSDVLGRISSHYRESQHGTRRRQQKILLLTGRIDCDH